MTARPQPNRGRLAPRRRSPRADADRRPTDTDPHDEPQPPRRSAPALRVRERLRDFELLGERGRRGACGAGLLLRRGERGIDVAWRTRWVCQRCTQHVST